MAISKTVSFPKDLLASAREAAFDARKSFSSFVQEAVAIHIQRTSRRVQTPSR